MKVIHSPIEAIEADSFKELVAKINAFTKAKTDENKECFSQIFPPNSKVTDPNDGKTHSIWRAAVWSKQK